MALSSNQRFILSAFADEAGSSLAGQIQALTQVGIQYLEIRGVEGKNITACSLNEVKAIKKELDFHHIQVSSIGSPLGKTLISADFDPELELLRYTIEIARILASPYIRMFSFYLPEGADPGEFRDEVIRRWRAFLRIAENQPVILLHENEKNIYGDTPERCLDLLRTVKSPQLKAVFDPANFIQCQVEAYPHAFALLKSYIQYVHIKDALFHKPQVVPAGEGDANIRAMLQDLNDSGYRGFLSVEPHLSSFAGRQDLEKRPVALDNPAAPRALFGVAVIALKNIIARLE